MLSVPVGSPAQKRIWGQRFGPHRKQKMATLDELKLAHRLFMRGYPFGRFAVADAPRAGLRRPLAESRFALVTTGGLRCADDVPFDHSIRSGDASFREIPGDVRVADLVEDHKSTAFDHSGIAADRNLALPLDRFRELVGEGRIGSLGERHFSFMGSIIEPARLIGETAPAVASKLAEDAVDAVFLTPV